MFESVGQIAAEFWAVLGEMAPYLLFGFLVAGALSVLVSPEWVERHLGGRGVLPVAKASLFGVPLPLCSCGVIPVAASLRRPGARGGPTAAFLLSTPQTGVDSILVTLSLLGPVFAIFRPLAALATGLAGGTLVTLFGAEGDGEQSVPACTEACCAGDESRGKLRRGLAYGFVALPRDIGRSLLVGLAIAGVISALVPKDLFAGVFGTGLLAMLVMMAVGLPIYVCATASVPIAAALIAKGVSPGAALVFLMTGPATNAAAFTTVWKVLGKRASIVYLCTVAASALACGLLLDHIEAPLGWMLPGSVKAACAVALLAILAAPMLRRPNAAAGSAEPEGAAETSTLLISGMTCTHCAATVRRALAECPGVRAAEVDLDTGRAVVTGEKLDVALLVRSVEELGYGGKEE